MAERARNSKVSVIFESEPESIVDVQKLSQLKRKFPPNRRSLCSLGAPKLEGVEEVDEEEDDNDLEILGGGGLTDSKEKGGGRELFGFRTPSKKNQMAEKVASSVRLTPKSCPTTPTSKTNTPSRKRLLCTPTSSSKKGGTPSKAANTPYSFRKRVSKRLEQIQSDDEEEEEESEDSGEESDDSDELGSESDEHEAATEQPPDTPRRSRKGIVTTPSTPATPLRKGRKPKAAKSIDVKETADGYFEAHGVDKIETSDRTLSRLKTPRLSKDAMKTILSDQKNKYEAEIMELMEDHSTRFEKWKLLLEEDFSIVTFGLGSKKDVLENFRDEMLSEEDCFVINGFFPSLTLKQILEGIIEDIIQPCTSTSYSGVSDQVDYILRNIEDPLFLIIHNIDGQMLRPEKVQSVLAQLAASPKIHLICSIDHINAPLIWDQNKLSKFNFVWYDVTTFKPYIEETLNENSLMVQQSNSLALSSLAAVFASLPANAKGIYLLLAKFQLESLESNENYNGISFPNLYQRCREAFLVNSDLTLRAQLTEFIDHKVIKIKKASDGLDHLTIPLNIATLKEFVESQEDRF